MCTVIQQYTVYIVLDVYSSRPSSGVDGGSGRVESGRSSRHTARPTGEGERRRVEWSRSFGRSGVEGRDERRAGKVVVGGEGRKDRFGFLRFSRSNQG